MTEQQARQKIVSIAQSYIGCKESDGSYKQIIDLYNSHKPLARGYKVKYTDAWCATFASAVAIKAGMTDIIPTECGCGKHVELFKAMGCWMEDESRKPQPGDYIFYDWQDGTNYASNDNTGAPDHVGIVEKVSGKTITVIEGNYSNAVKRRTLAVNGRYIRGYGVPNYAKATGTAAVPTSTATTPAKMSTAFQHNTTPVKVAVEAAQSFDKALAGTYKTTASLRLRTGAGTNKAVQVVVPKGKTVRNYGYYTLNGGVKWLYVQYTDTVEGKTYTGFCSKSYLTK